MSLVTIISFIFFLLTGCIGQSTEEKMFDILEDVVKQEKSFEEQQEPLMELEKKERELYKEINSLGSQDYDQIVKLADEAISMVSNRKKHMDTEQKSIKSSEDKFKSFSAMIPELKDAELKNEAKELDEMMSSRYKIHDQLYEYYLLGIKYDTELYQMLKNKDVSLEQLTDQVTKINNTYDKVLQANEKFNDKTKKYNETKLAFYKKAGLSVSK